MFLSSRKAVAYLAAVVLLSSSVLHAEVTAGIQGTVTDPSGATVPNATVTLKNRIPDWSAGFRPTHPAVISS